MAETTDQQLNCSFCKKTSSEDSRTKKLLQCSRCKKISYCGTNCQKQDWPSHRKVCIAPNYILKIDLAPDYLQDGPGDSITNPCISRTLSCPANATFSHLHEALQTAFGYVSTHSYDFLIRDPNAEPEDLSLESLVTQLSAGQGEHKDRGPRQNLLRIVDFDGPAMGQHIMRSPDAFQTNRRKHSQTPEIAAAKIKLPKVFDNKEYGNSRIEYTYDLGDCWWHIITVQGREPATGRFLCLDGQGHGVAEDVGSIRGWEALKEAYRSQNPTEEQKKKMQWFENSASNRDPEGLANGRDKFWDKEEINLNLGDII